MAESNGLLNRRTGNRTGGSNPPLSAIFILKFDLKNLFSPRFSILPCKAPPIKSCPHLTTILLRFFVLALQDGDFRRASLRLLESVVSSSSKCRKKLLCIRICRFFYQFDQRKYVFCLTNRHFHSNFITHLILSFFCVVTEK